MYLIPPPSTIMLYEACPTCGELARVSALPDGFMLQFTCPACGFHDRWLIPTPENQPAATSMPAAPAAADPLRIQTIHVPIVQNLHNVNVPTGSHETCSTCGAGVDVYRHHTVELEGYACPCGHASVWTPAAPEMTTVERDYWAVHERLLDMLLEKLPALVDNHAERANRAGITPDWTGDLKHLQSQLTLLIAYLEVNEGLS